MPPADAPAAPVPVEAFESGGVRVLLKRNPAHEVVAVRLYARGGASNLDPWRAGAEMMYARVARRGTQRFPKARLNAELARLGAELAFIAGDDYTIFNLRCLRRVLDAAWELYTDVILQPLLQAGEMEIVRQQMLLELRQLHDDPDGALAERARRHCFAGHPYAPSPQGSEFSVRALDASLLREHMSRVLVRRNLLLAVAGNLERDALETRLAAGLAQLPEGETARPLPPPLRYERGSLLIESRELPTNYVLGQFTAPSLSDPDYYAALLVASVLRDRFFEEVRTKRNLSYAPSANLGHDAANLGSVYVTAVDPPATLRVMRAEMRRLQEERMDDKELADKVRVFVTRYWLQNETSHAQAGFLATHEILAGGWRRSLEFVPRLDAVTPDDVQRVARTMLRCIQYVYLGDPARADPTAITDP